MTAISEFNWSTEDRPADDPRRGSVDYRREYREFVKRVRLNGPRDEEVSKTSRACVTDIQPA